MSLEAVARRWMELRARLRQQVRVLIVEDANEVAELLSSCVQLSGFLPERVATAEEALARVRQQDFDLVIADKNLPGHDGIALIGQLRAEGVETPCVLVTGYPSTDTIARAFAQGAVDYLTKPFDDIEHLQRRFEGIVQKRRERLAMQQVVVDLKYIAESGGVDHERVRGLGKELALARKDLARRPDVLLVDKDPLVAESGARFLERAGLTVIHPSDNMSLPQQVRLRGPMVVFLSLDVPNAHQHVERIRHADGTVAVLATGRSSGIDDALAAVRAGADDYSLGASEGLDLLVARLRRLSQRARREYLAEVLVDLVARTLEHLSADVQQAFRDLFSSVDIHAERVEHVLDLGRLDVLDDEGDLPEAELVDDPPDEEGGEGFPVAALLAPSVSFGDPSAGPMTLAGAGGALGAHATSLREQLEYGLGAVPAATVPLPVVEVLRAYRTLAEVTRFFSDEARSTDAALVSSFLRDEDALGALLRAQNELRARLPPQVRSSLDGGGFAHPWAPRYLKS